MRHMFGKRAAYPKYQTVAFLALLILLGLMSIPSAASAQGEANPDSVQAILSRLNAERAAAGLGALAIDHLLSQAAQAHANDILYNGNYSHWGTDGTLARHRVARTGYSDSPWVSENWVSSRNPEAAMNWWMNDYIHRVNILTPRWSEVGIGVAGSQGSGEMIFVTVFSAGRGAKAAVASVQPSAASTSSVVEVVDVPPGGLSYTVRPGDTLLEIAIRHGYDYAEIADVNGLDVNTLLQIGQTLYIPGSDAGDESFDIGGVGGPIATVTEPYTIQAGDTLVSIANRHGLTWRQLAAQNGLGEYTILSIGQIIQLPVEEKATIEEPVASEDPLPVEEPKETILKQAITPTQSDFPAVSAAALVHDEPAEAALTHVVAAGDTLFGLSLEYGIELADLLALNGLNDNSLLQLGQEIKLR